MNKVSCVLLWGVCGKIKGIEILFQIIVMKYDFFLLLFYVRYFFQQ